MDIVPAARVLGIPTTEVRSVDDCDLGTVVRTTDGQAYLLVDGELTGFLFRPTDTYNGSTPCHFPQVIADGRVERVLEGLSPDPGDDEHVHSDGDADYGAWKVTELRAVLTERGLDPKGNKGELVERLEADDLAAAEAAPAATPPAPVGDPAA